MNLIAHPGTMADLGPARDEAIAELRYSKVALNAQPPWFVTNRTAATTGRLLADFAAAPPLVGAAEDLRLRAARLKTDTRPLSYGSPEKGETMTMTAI
ncbi:hypothetical protein [Streptomyces sp. NBC_00299]|uniref:hypothetical protein n=1 Tax=Streptomyces sp. NBC_00299 TaxID=2975705 RepID=UPI002E29DE05|nr:hypothetical protein [Streptomyces sp. NBC_00299]